MENGWIKLHRKILQSNIWPKRRYSLFEAWVYILLNAYYEEGYWRGVKIHPGQFPTTQRDLARQFKWSLGLVNLNINLLKSCTQITTKTTREYTIITICKWKQYQDKNKKTEQNLNTNLNTIYNKKEERKNIYNNYPQADRFEENLTPKEKFFLKVNEIKTASVIAGLILFTLIGVKPVNAYKIEQKFTIRSPHAKVQIVRTVKKKPVKRNVVATVKKTIEPYKKYLTDTGSKTREKVLAYLSTYYTGEQLTAADNILKKEAGYRYDAVNSIGAGGIPQAYPYQKMGCPLTEEGIECQTQWFVGYVNRRYGDPLQAWSFHIKNNWY
jgi:hypothetical protein